jgi:hypothetical protein
MNTPKFRGWFGLKLRKAREYPRTDAQKFKSL